MENKFFLHRIRKDGENYTMGIEVHDTLDAAIQSFHSQMKMAYNNPSYPDMVFDACMVTNGDDRINFQFNETWNKEEATNFFVHYIRYDGTTFTKGIEVHSDYGAAYRSYHTHMEYGYGNTKFPNISFVAAKITGSGGMVYKEESWTKPE